MAPRPRAAGFARAEAALRAHALTKPEATEHFPWGERAIKVKGKVFLFMRADAQQLSLSTKLPQSGSVALLLPFATPTGYGLGKAGWVSAAFGPSDPLPVDMLCSWIDESYQAVAPAKLAALARSAE
jgi:predicted DNA-binding protein (MmcQ/YjbR family)